MRTLLVVVTLALAAPIARADQCAWITDPQAEGARARLRPGTEILLYCELCDGDTPKPDVVRTVDVRVAGGNAKEVVVNGRPIDLAYVFVKREGTTWDNLARLAECEATGVSHELTWPPSSTTPKLSTQERYVGRYTRKDELVTIHLKAQKLHGPHWVAMRIELISDEWGDQRGELKGYLHAERSPAVFVTPFSGCHLLVEREGKNDLVVKDNGKCGLVGDRVRGTYSRSSGK